MGPCSCTALLHCKRRRRNHRVRPCPNQAHLSISTKNPFSRTEACQRLCSANPIRRLHYSNKLLPPSRLRRGKEFCVLARDERILTTSPIHFPQGDLVRRIGTV